MQHQVTTALIAGLALAWAGCSESENPSPPDDGSTTEGDRNEDGPSSPEWKPEPGTVVIDRIVPEPVKPGERITIEGTFPGDGRWTWILMSHSEPDIISFSNNEIETEVPIAETTAITGVSVYVRDVKSNAYNLDLIQDDEPSEPSRETCGDSESLVPEVVDRGETFFLSGERGWDSVEGFVFGGVSSPEWSEAPAGYRVMVPTELSPEQCAAVQVRYSGLTEEIGNTWIR